MQNAVMSLVQPLWGNQIARIVYCIVLQAHLQICTLPYHKGPHSTIHSKISSENAWMPKMPKIHKNCWHLGWSRHRPQWGSLWCSPRPLVGSSLSVPSALLSTYLPGMPPRFLRLSPPLQIHNEQVHSQRILRVWCVPDQITARWWRTPLHARRRCRNASRTHGVDAENKHVLCNGRVHIWSVM